MDTLNELLSQAGALESAGEFARAIKCYGEALGALQAEGPTDDRACVLDLLYRRATAHRFQGELAAALSGFEQCVVLAEEAEETHWAARSHRAMGEVFLRQKQIDLAIEAFRRALDIAESAGDALAALQTQSRLGRAMCDAGLIEEAMALTGRIFEQLRETTTLGATPRKQTAAQAYLTLGVACFKTGRGRRAKRFLHRALEHLNPERDRLPLAECQRYLGILESDDKNFMQATPALSEALKAYTRLGFDPGRFDAYLSLGITYMDMGDLRNARLCLQCAEKIARAGKLQAELARCQSRFADLEMREGNYEAARLLYEEDLQLTQQTSDRQALGYCHGNLAQVCRALKEYESAAEHARRSEEHFRATNRDHLVARSRLELAEGYLEQGLFDEAREAVDEAETALGDRGRIESRARILALRARLRMEQGEQEDALSSFDKAIDAYLQYPPTRSLAETRFEAAVACQSLGRTREALDHLRNAVGLSETLGCRDIRERALRMMEDLDVLDAQRMKLAPYLPSGAVDELSTDWLDIDRKKEAVVATVMFVDMRGYTGLSGTIDELELADTMESFVSLVVRTVRQNGGTVDKFIGDCVMATFGLGQTPEQGARMALWTGVEILEQLGVASDVHVDARRRPIHGALGVNTGQVLAGCFGPLEKRDYTVVGYHVNLASRLQSLASEVTDPTPNRLVLSDATLRHAPGIVRARKLAEHELTLKGIEAGGLTAWLVTGRA